MIVCCRDGGLSEFRGHVVRAHFLHVKVSCSDQTLFHCRVIQKGPGRGYCRVKIYQGSRNDEDVMYDT